MWIIKNDNGTYFREMEYPNEPREKRWVKKRSLALERHKKLECDLIIDLGYLTKCKSIRVKKL